MSALERVGYVAITKTGRGRGDITAYRITDDGRTAGSGLVTSLGRFAFGGQNDIADTLGA